MRKFNTTTGQWEGDECQVTENRELPNPAYQTIEAGQPPVEWPEIIGGGQVFAQMPDERPVFRIPRQRTQPPVRMGDATILPIEIDYENVRPPLAVMEAARLVRNWFEQLGIRNWQLMGIQSTATVQSHIHHDMMYREQLPSVVNAQEPTPIPQQDTPF